MSHTLAAYLIYIAIAVPLVVFVARTLSRHGAIFLREVFHGNDGLAAAVNHLLVVGFYLLNLGYVSLFLRTDRLVDSAEEVLELVSRKVGVVAIVLGVVHLVNVWVFNTLRRNATFHRQTELPVTTDEFTEVTQP
ncbi:hypothetical protein [Ilumatobacter sp.]|uniref:hypothetical protein n=1 Tax=Ilumatobacter sp. TaxID=1967498 RepID=UPI003AF66106